MEVELPSSPSGGADSDGAEADVDVDDLDSDVDCMEGLDGEVVAVRTWALEEQATACQMILLLAEALQVRTAVYVDRTFANESSVLLLLLSLLLAAFLLWLWLWLLVLVLVLSLWLLYWL